MKGFLKKMKILSLRPPNPITDGGLGGVIVPAFLCFLSQQWFVNPTPPFFKVQLIIHNF